ncbi:MAG: HNH endonuclease, partial [Gordonia sp. (in: high G+C Gram-positive bacteria)]
PEGFTVRQQALNTWLLPEAGLIPCQHAPIGAGAAGVTRRESGHAENNPRRAKSRTEAKHAYRMARRAANRRIREQEAARTSPQEGTPPF